MKKYIILIFTAALVMACNSQAQNKEEQAKTEVQTTKTKIMDSEVIKLVAPQETGTTLLDAMKSRTSVREYAGEELTLEQLSGILWATSGENRPDGKHTTPSAMGLYPIKVYAILPNGIYLYDSKEHHLTLVKKGDHRQMAGTQEFVYTAPLNLMYITDLQRFDERKPAYPMENERLFVSALDAGHYSQSAALWATANGMGSVPRGWTNGEKFLETIGAPESYRAVLAQTFGIMK